MKITRMSNAEPRSNPHGVDARTIYDQPSAQIVHIELKPGEALKRHITPVDVAFYVLEGEGTVEIGEESEMVGEDSIVESPAGIPHLWRNDGDGTFRVLVIKAPRPPKGTKAL